MKKGINTIDIPRPEAKLKKIPSGPLREKNRTTNKIIFAVGKVLEKKGYTALTIINIAAEAKVSAKLIYLYFGTIENLIDTFLKQRDFWNMAEKGVEEELLKDVENIGKTELTRFLQSQYDKLYKDKLVQKLIHWELGEQIPELRKITDNRELVRAPLLESVEQDFSKTDIDIRSMLSIQIAGIYYLVLHAKTNGSTFCGIDINTVAGKARLNKTIEDMINLLYAQIGK